ncbi:MAG: glycosyl transferase [Alphaproteobacteria bacterium]|jgi:glycosyltransferase involved in cell wall biosynthesis|nr:glycosyl transferase [Alphaproteobacteria bacterium]
MPELRILQVLPELNSGGVEHVTLDMVAALRQRYAVTYVASQGGTLLPNLEQRGGTHMPLPLASKNPVQMMLNAFTLARLVRTHHIQLIHARSRAPAWSALWAAHWTKVPLVTTCHGAYASSNPPKAFYNSVMVRGDRVIAISEFIAQRIQRQYPASLPRVRLIREGIDLEEFNPRLVSQQERLDLRKAWNIPATATLFLMPGRVTRLKGQTVFIDAIRRLNNPNIMGVILGQNQDNSSYPAEVRCQSEGLPIRLIPHILRPRVAYGAADFIVSASLAEEAFGRVTAEAGAMKRIVIATNHGATVELCQSAKTGFLIPPGDSRALADAMMNAMKMPPEDYRKMGETARAYVCANFSLERMCTETIDLYKELIQ